MTEKVTSFTQNICASVVPARKCRVIRRRNGVSLVASATCKSANCIRSGTTPCGLYLTICTQPAFSLGTTYWNSGATMKPIGANISANCRKRDFPALRAEYNAKPQRQTSGADLTFATYSAASSRSECQIQSSTRTYTC